MIGLGSDNYRLRNASSHHYLGLRDRLELGRNTFATALKLLYAFVWQVALVIEYFENTYFCLCTACQAVVIDLGGPMVVFMLKLIFMYKYLTSVYT